MNRRPLPLVLDDEKAERVRRSHHAALEELQALALVGAVVIPDVVLVNGVATAIAHKRGRAAAFVLASVPRGAVTAGYIVETRPAGTDLSKYLTLTASGYGATVTVDLVVA